MNLNRATNMVEYQLKFVEWAEFFPQTLDLGLPFKEFT